MRGYEHSDEHDILRQLFTSVITIRNYIAEIELRYKLPYIYQAVDTYRTGGIQPEYETRGMY